jgi:molybdopterin synthase sulfur carrier subunit
MHLFKAQNIAVLQLVDPFGRHAVLAAQIAPVGDREAEIADAAAVAVLGENRQGGTLPYISFVCNSRATCRCSLRLEELVSRHTVPGTGFAAACFQHLSHIEFQEKPRKRTARSRMKQLRAQRFVAFCDNRLCARQQKRQPAARCSTSSSSFPSRARAFRLAWDVQQKHRACTVSLERFQESYPRFDFLQGRPRWHSRRLEETSSGAHDSENRTGRFTQVIIRYFADFRALTGCGEETWTKAAPNVSALLDGLAAQYGAAFRERFFEDGQLSKTVILFINGRDIVHLKGMDTPLKEDDTVAIFPVIAGG